MSSVKATHERKENPVHITMAIYYYYQGAEIVKKYLTDDAVTMYLQLWPDETVMMIEDYRTVEDSRKTMFQKKSRLRIEEQVQKSQSMRIVWGHETDSNPGRYSLRQFHMVDNEDEEKSRGEISNFESGAE